MKVVGEQPARPSVDETGRLELVSGDVGVADSHRRIVGVHQAREHWHIESDGGKTSGEV